MPPGGVVQRLLAFTSSGLLLVGSIVGAIWALCRPAKDKYKAGDSTGSQENDQSQPLLVATAGGSSDQRQHPGASSPRAALRNRPAHGESQRPEGSADSRAVDSSTLVSGAAATGPTPPANKRSNADGDAASALSSATFQRPRDGTMVAARGEKYLKQLLDDQFGPPKFAVQKPVGNKRPASGAGAASAAGGDHLQALIDSELGPPKFATPRSPSLEASPKVTASAAADRQSANQAAAPVASPLLRLQVLSGPAAGQVYETTNTASALVIGRYPDSSLHINDQEVSGKHVVINFCDEKKHWHVMDVGSLNGTILNGFVISAEYRVEGDRHALAEADVLELGSATRMRIAACTPAPARREFRQTTDSVADDLTAIHGRTSSGSRQGAAPAGVQASTSAPAPPAPGRFRTHALKIHNVLPPHLAVEAHPELDLKLAVHQRLGFDHKRMGTGCEDVVHWEVPCAAFASSAMFCVFDGHHGPRAAQLAKELLPPAVVSKLQAAGPPGSASAGIITGRPQEAQRVALRDAFVDTDAAIAMDEGCTATVLMLERNSQGGVVLQAANVGDSSAVVVLPPARPAPSGDASKGESSGGNAASTSNNGASASAQPQVDVGEFHKLSEDHRIASSSSERARLQQRGHTVRTRLYGLNISRMLGDKFLKDENLGFLAEPYVSAPYTVAPGRSAYLILASDGLWDVVPEQRAAALVLKALEEESDVTVEELVDILLNQAIQMRSKDDISVAVVHVHARGNAPAGPPAGG